ncbi:TPA: HNH endonuclease [Citrobacter koseri]|uniref:NUMOD4 domain-containing protein n=1 Tax=Citrobacter koseri TaxID=545 RepID=UPI0023AEDD06|nr:NUMOD4 domain-containing protein [Citrobacter koseri]HBL6925884.1 HNH endonuclease [Citrobacter koseri]HBL6930787.1 HNH endonuclease [Citrobacter koseri]
MEEIWRPVSGFENYYRVSNSGSVKSLDRVSIHSNGTVTHRKGRILKPALKVGYPFVVLVGDDGKKQFHIHRLVASAFCNKPEGCDVVNHLDGNKLNNHASNLEWTTTKGNTAHAIKTGLLNPARGENSSASILTEQQVEEIRRRLSLGERGSHLAKEFGVKNMAISQIRTGRTWRHIASQEIIESCKDTANFGSKGSTHPQAKITESDVIEIIKLLCQKVPQKTIAEKFGCIPETVSRINMGKAWKHVVVDGCGNPPYYRRRPHKNHSFIDLSDAVE